MKRVTEVLIGVSLLVVSTSVLAQTLSIRGGFTGNWTDPIANRQGIQIEIIDPRRAVVAWFIYDIVRRADLAVRCRRGPGSGHRGRNAALQQRHLPARRC